jgi:SAM-dependent methyltransferase
MEHVPDIGKGFSEMVRVTRPGGIIYSVAAPLWNSPYGHHKPDLFQPDHPWIHLLLDKEEIYALCEREGIIPADGAGIRHHVEYMLHPEFFNMKPARLYTEVCASFKQINVIRNSLDCLPESCLSAEVEKELAEKGYSREELLAVTHVFIGQKINPKRSVIIDRMLFIWKRRVLARDILVGIKRRIKNVLLGK